MNNEINVPVILSLFMASDAFCEYLMKNARQWITRAYDQMTDVPNQTPYSPGTRVARDRYSCVVPSWWDGKPLDADVILELFATFVAKTLRHDGLLPQQMEFTVAQCEDNRMKMDMTPARGAKL